MTRKSRRHKKAQQNQRMLIVGMVAALALIAVLFAITRLSGSGEASSTVSLLRPSEYNAQFLDSSSDHFLLDVRTVEEFNEEHISGAANINVDVLASRLSDVPSGVPIVVYCRSGNRSARAAQILADAGYTDIYDMGGILDWVSAGYPIQQ